MAAQSRRISSPRRRPLRRRGPTIGREFISASTPAAVGPFPLGLDALAGGAHGRQLFALRVASSAARWAIICRLAPALLFSAAKSISPGSQCQRDTPAFIAQVVSFNPFAGPPLVTPTPGCLPNCEISNRWLATARLRFGYSFDWIIPYVTAGVAMARLEADISGTPLGRQSAE